MRGQVQVPVNKVKIYIVNKVGVPMCRDKTVGTESDETLKNGPNMGILGFCKLLELF